MLRQASRRHHGCCARILIRLKRLQSYALGPVAQSIQLLPQHLIGRAHGEDLIGIYRLGIIAHRMNFPVIIPPAVNFS